MKNPGFFKGKLKYTVRVENPVVFLNYVKMYSDVISVCIQDGNTVCFTCFFNASEGIEKCIKACDGCVIVRKPDFAVSLRSRLKKRIGLICGFVLSALLVFASTFFVWDIRVKGNETLSEKEIVEMLSKAGFEKGMLIRSADVKQIANRVLINEDELSWIAINFEGTVATAEVKEAERPQRHIKKENVNIVAAHNGIVMRVDALDGGAQVGKGDTVVKGQLLISSFVEKRTGGSILKGAKGFVWAKTERCFCAVVPLEYCEKQYTGRVSSGRVFSLLGKKIEIPPFMAESFSEADARYSNVSLSLSDKIILPFEAQVCRVSEYEKYTKRRTENEALNIARETVRADLFRASEGFKIADIIEKYEVSDGRLFYECKFEGVENIAEELEFELL